MNQTTLLLNLLAMERQWWQLGQEISNKYGPDIQDMAHLPFVCLILDLMGFPSGANEEEAAASPDLWTREKLYAAFDEGYEDPKKMLAWLTGQIAQLKCLVELKCCTFRPHMEQANVDEDAIPY